ncbi:MAG: hypothetical protein HYV76_03015 [Candidatus Vogelbacteria bacterium]|nr:hypothetical protein [Candidatus Vogelbacteria bacterium]
MSYKRFSPFSRKLPEIFGNQLDYSATWVRTRTQVFSLALSPTRLSLVVEK